MKRLTVLAALMLPLLSHAINPVPYTGALNNAEASILYRTLMARVGASVASVTATIDGIAAGATSFAEAAAVAEGVGIGAILWPIAVAGAGYYAYDRYHSNSQLPMDVAGTGTWQWNDHSSGFESVQLGGSVMSGSTYTAFPPMPADWASMLVAYPNADVYFRSTPSSTTLRHFKTFSALVCSPGVASVPCQGDAAASLVASANADFSLPYSGPYTVPYWAKVATVAQSGVATPPGSKSYSGVYELQAPSGYPIALPPYQGVDESVSLAPVHIPGSLATAYLSDQFLADEINRLWAAATALADPAVQLKPAPAGTPQPLRIVPASGFIPYSPTIGIKPSDVADWRVATPVAQDPTVQDLVSPVAPPGAQAVPMPVPAPGTVTPPTTTPGTTTIDWGTFSLPDPVSPTIESILDPIFNLFPGWKTFAFPSHSSTCPEPDLELVIAGTPHTFHFDQLCFWTERIRPQLQAAFAVMWAIAIVFVVMGA